MNSAIVASLLISLTLLLGRLSGFMREALLASRLGTSATADAVILLLTLPDFMVGLLISGGFNAALIPVLRQHAGSDRVFLTRRAGLVITVGFTVLALVLSMFAEQVIRVFIPVADFAALTGFIIGFKLSMVALPVAALIGVSASYLNASGRFAIPGVSVLVFNGIVCIYFLQPFINLGNLVYFGAVVILASLFRLLFQLSCLNLHTFHGPSLLA